MENLRKASDKDEMEKDHPHLTFVNGWGRPQSNIGNMFALSICGTFIFLFMDFHFLSKKLARHFISNFYVSVLYILWNSPKINIKLYIICLRLVHYFCTPHSSMMYNGNTLKLFRMLQFSTVVISTF
jgi:hypothetical protein